MRFSLDDLDVDALTTEAQWALREVATRVADGYSYEEVAEQLDVPRSRIVSAMRLLRVELRAQDAAG